ncbi:MAG: bifunctional UDP-sugar hydrolase/5'-nucleotidase [Salinivirgaceae bacterium]|jgi:5'-nucleotidase/UDP-sugar diphosphatase|nr:bifunctional UDP-sugar hydrolase/5'-nucleotidase [Salinivirgaceae bacterium]
MRKNLIFLIAGIAIPVFLLTQCSQPTVDVHRAEKVSIFFVNDAHGQLENFAKIKPLIDSQKMRNPVLLVSSGDMFSGNPVVDYFQPKGYPMIDVMNRLGFDALAIGNHEFDYGEEVLIERIEQSTFPWLCANIDTSQISLLISPYVTICAGDRNITFVGFVETGGKQGTAIPSTHPRRVENYTFHHAEDVVGQFDELKATTNSDLMVALSHLGFSNTESHAGDVQLALENSLFDVIIGGHSHSRVDTVVSGVLICQAGSYLNYIGQVDVVFDDEEVKTLQYKEVFLDTLTVHDDVLREHVDRYNMEMNTHFDEQIGCSNTDHTIGETGRFYTEAIRSELNVDLVLQNPGGVRWKVQKGAVTRRQILEIDPFNNGLVIYKLSVSNVATFLKQSNARFYYAGYQLNYSNRELQMFDEAGHQLADTVTISLAVNDYIAAVYSHLLPRSYQEYPLKSSETIISYVRSLTQSIDFTGSSQVVFFGD